MTHIRKEDVSKRVFQYAHSKYISSTFLIMAGDLSAQPLVNHLRNAKKLCTEKESPHLEMITSVLMCCASLRSRYCHSPSS